uniref:Activating molecule in BECN1-regulated autophagy protein 1 n=4 Tax=Clastoptera arizonana TaxID=38151 RepID=A0A1B6BX04_9HEMI
MVDNLRLFFENDNLNQRTSNEALHDRIYNLYMLLQLALNLTDLLLTQLASSRNELEYRRRNISTHVARDHDYFRNRQRCLRITTTSDAWRRIRRSTVPEPHDSSSQSQSTTPTTPTGLTENQRDPTQRIILGRGPRGLPHRHQAVFSNIRNSLFSQRISVPVVHVNGLPAPPVENNPPPRPPYSPPPYPIDTSGNHYVLTPRFLHPRYVGPNPFDESTSEDSSPQERQDSYLRGFGSSSVFLNDTPVSPHHRIQAWDFSKYNIPDISNVDKNIVVSECKIHNDASVDVSHDGRMLVTLLPSGRLSITTMLGVYSLQWETLGQLLYTTSFEQNAVSVSISPTTRHLVVGLASRRSVLINTDRYPNAQVYKLEKGTSAKKAPSKARGKLVHVKDLELSHNFALMSLNCIRWAPNPGQGLVYGTNTGQLKIIR